MIIRPIKSERDHAEALAAIDGLLEARPNTRDGDRLEILTTLVQAYEERHHPIPPPDPVAAIRYHLESRGMKTKDLEPSLGGADRVRQVLAGKRPLTLAMVRKLHALLGIPAEILIGTPTGRRPRTSKTAADLRSAASARVAGR